MIFQAKTQANIFLLNWAPGYEEIDEDEIDSYIRTEAEVEALKPIFEKVLATAAAN